MSAPMPIQAQIDHIEASILGIQDAVQNGDMRASRGKAADPLRSIKVARLESFKAVKASLEFLRDHKAVIRSAVSASSERAA